MMLRAQITIVILACMLLSLLKFSSIDFRNIHIHKDLSAVYSEQIGCFILQDDNKDTTNHAVEWCRTKLIKD